MKCTKDRRPTCELFILRNHFAKCLKRAPLCTVMIIAIFVLKEREAHSKRYFTAALLMTLFCSLSGGSSRTHFCPVPAGSINNHLHATLRPLWHKRDPVQRTLMSQRNLYWHLSPTARIYRRDKSTCVWWNAALSSSQDASKCAGRGAEVKSAHPWHLIAGGGTYWISHTDYQWAERRWEDPNGEVGIFYDLYQVSTFICAWSPVKESISFY